MESMEYSDLIIFRQNILPLLVDMFYITYFNLFITVIQVNDLWVLEKHSPVSIRQQ